LGQQFRYPTVPGSETPPNILGATACVVTDVWDEARLQMTWWEVNFRGCIYRAISKTKPPKPEEMEREDVTKQAVWSWEII
jgi:hypothetical protein